MAFGDIQKRKKSKWKPRFHTAVDLELDDLADAIDKAEHELEKVITKHPELS